MRAWWTPLLLTTLMAGCSGAAPDRQGAVVALDGAAMRTVVADLNAAYTRAHVAGDIAAIDAMFAPDATSWPPGDRPAVGVAAIHALSVAYLETGVKAFDMVSTDVYGGPGVVVDSGTYTMTYGPGNVVDRGKYVNVWTQRDGAWKIRTNIWNAGPATETTMDATALQDFGRRYTAAWCSQDAASVAAFFGEQGSLTINAGTPAVGRAAITASAQGFMTAFPDMVVAMDSVAIEGAKAIYRWTLTGTNTGPGGTGKRVRITGHEEWTFGADGLIAQSLGHFDEADYNRQLGK